MVFLVTVTILAIAAATAVVADGRGHDVGTWFVLGAALPGVALALLLLDHRRQSDEAPRADVDAARHSPVVRYLAAGGDAAPADVAEALAVSEPEVLAELRVLQVLDVTQPTPARRWRLTPEGRDLLEPEVIDLTDAAQPTRRPGGRHRHRPAALH